MKSIDILKISVLYCCLFLSGFHSSAQSNTYGKVFFIGDMRTYDNTSSLAENALHSLVTHANIFIDSNIVCQLPEARYSVHDVPAGDHLFSAQGFGIKMKHAEGKTITIEADKNYFFQVYAKDRDVYLVKISESFGQKILSSIKQVSDCHIKQTAKN